MTGEVSMRMIKDAGAQLVEIGHSERREFFTESDQDVARKVRAAVDQGHLIFRIVKAQCFILNREHSYIQNIQ